MNFGGYVSHRERRLYSFLFLLSFPGERISLAACYEWNRVLKLALVAHDDAALFFCLLNHLGLSFLVLTVDSLIAVNS